MFNVAVHSINTAILRNYILTQFIRFWQYGRWVDVVIDDKLPYQRATGTLFSVRSRQKNEFWSALLEKAYAKVHGSYEALNDGVPLDAMQDFTGGISEMLRFRDNPPTLYDILRKSYERGSILFCVLKDIATKYLKEGHAYSITNVRYINKKDSPEHIPLLRLRNPWGKVEWNGAWSDGSTEWDSVSEEDKKALGVCIRDEGEFWICFEDFERCYTRVEICHLSPLPSHSGAIDYGDDGWKVSFFEGKWVKNVTAGGGSCFRSTFCNNPQYRITLTEADEGEDECTLIVGLLQKFRRHQKHLGINNLPIACEIYRLDNPDGVPIPLDTEFLSTNDAIVASPEHLTLREFSRRVNVPPGIYCLIPSTDGPNQEGEFIIRVFTEQKHVFEEHDDQVAYEESNVIQEVVKVCSTYEELRKDDQANELFSKYAGDVGTINWTKLKLILDSVLSADKEDIDFSKNVCRSLLAMLDRDQSGELSLDEFRLLWKDVQEWKGVFQLFDEDKSGTLGAFELRKALNSVGFRVNCHILNLLMQRFSNQRGQLELEDFIMCAVKLKTMISIFNEEDPLSTEKVTFTLNKWLESSLYT
ncbi:hypothetical protein Trydic_g7799, partial [Trypoxylus dichotomus]